MSAFVPHVPVAANSFARGSAAPAHTNRVALPSAAAPRVTMMADEPEKKGLKMSFRIDKLMRSRSEKKKTEVAKADAVAKARAQSKGTPVAPKVTAPKASVTVGGKVAAKPLPKFYNPTTARYEFAANTVGQNATPYDVRIISDTVSAAGNARINPNGTFRNMDLYTDDLVWARPAWSVEDAEAGVRAALKQVFGNANLFDSDIEQLNYSISCVKMTANMKEFVRALGLSALYREKFFESTSNLRFVELNFKHFLGRAPHSQEEVSEHIRIINEEGYNAEINSYVDSDEYDALYGDSRVPAVNFQGGYPENVQMNRNAILNGSYVSSDRVSTRAFLNGIDTAKYSSFSVLKGLPTAWRGENSARADAGIVSDFPTAFWNPVPDVVVSDALAWKMKFGSWQKYWYKDSIIYKTMMKPVLTHSSEEKEEAEAILKYGSLQGKMYAVSRD